MRTRAISRLLPGLDAECLPPGMCLLHAHSPSMHSSALEHARMPCAGGMRMVCAVNTHAIYACNMHAMGTSASRLSAIHPFVQAWKAEASSGARSRLAACVPEASHRARQGAEPAAASGAHGQVTCRRRSIAYTLASHRSVQHDHAQETSR